jgi:membrane associated rhomboid family serine protease
MPRTTSFDMGLPAFRGAVRQIIIASTAIYIAMLLTIAFAPTVAEQILKFAVLTPEHIRQGWLWQFVTYGFVYGDPLNFALTMLGIYFIGTAVQEQVGSRRFYGLYLSSLVLAGIAGFLLSLTHVIAQGATAGAGPAANAILMVFYLLYREAPIMIFPLPIQIPVKYVVIFTAAIETAYLLLYRFLLHYCVLLLGLGAGYVWYTLVYRKGLVPSVSIAERYYGLRNSYYRWKRRRAAKKFQVYMKKHNRDVYFDEYGNYKPPDDKKDDGGTWVN